MLDKVKLNEIQLEELTYETTVDFNFPFSRVTLVNNGWWKTISLSQVGVVSCGRVVGEPRQLEEEHRDLLRSLRRDYLCWLAVFREEHGK